jgi:hypothetical protein
MDDPQPPNFEVADREKKVQGFEGRKDRKVERFRVCGIWKLDWNSSRGNDG